MSTTKQQVLFIGKVIPVYNGHWLEERAHFEYTQAYSLEQAGRFLRQRFPKPKFIVKDVKVYPPQILPYDPC